MNKILADMHTHTIASGHAYATLTEMCKEAANKGLEIYGITEHSSGTPGTCADIYFQNLRVVPRDLFGLDLRLGAEINISTAMAHLILIRNILIDLILLLPASILYATSSAQKKKTLLQ